MESSRVGREGLRETLFPKNFNAQPSFRFLLCSLGRLLEEFGFNALADSLRMKGEGIEPGVRDERGPYVSETVVADWGVEVIVEGARGGPDYPSMVLCTPEIVRIKESLWGLIQVRSGRK